MMTIGQLTWILILAAALQAQTPGGVVGSGAAVGMISTPNFIGGVVAGMKGAPYSADAVTENIQTLVDGNRIVSRSTTNLYRDSEGRERREESLRLMAPSGDEGKVPRTIFISDPVAGVNYLLNLSQKTAVKRSLPRVFPAAMPGAAVLARPTTVPVTPSVAPQNAFYPAGNYGGGQNPPVFEKLGIRVIEGIQAEGTRNTITIPAGQIGNDRALQIVDEAWRSSELQVVVHSEHNDPRTGTRVYSLQNISRTEPSRSLFEVPADFTVTDSSTAGRPLPFPAFPPQ